MTRAQGFGPFISVIPFSLKAMSRAGNMHWVKLVRYFQSI